MEKGWDINQMVKGKIWIARSVPPSLREKMFEMAEIHFTDLKREVVELIDQVPFLDTSPLHPDG